MDLKKVERVYSKYASMYDHTFGKVFQQTRESAVRGLPVQPGHRILEVGIGTGEALPLYPSHCEVLGIDLSERMLEHALRRVEEYRLDHVTLQCMDAGNMDIPDDHFDIVMAAYVVTAVPDYRLVVDEMIRVCKPGGRIVMLNHFSNGNKVIAAVEKLISPLCKHIGFRTDLALHMVLEGTCLTVASKKKVNPLRFWHLVECVNKKDGKHQAVFTNGFATNGHVS